jgi:hypothetical protein
MIFIPIIVGVAVVITLMITLADKLLPYFEQLLGQFTAPVTLVMIIFALVLILDRISRKLKWKSLDKIE